MDLYFRLTGRCLSVLPRSFVGLRGQTWLDSFNVGTRRWIQSFSFTLYRKQVVLNLYFLEDLLVSNFRLQTLAFIRLMFTQNISLDQCQPRFNFLVVKSELRVRAWERWGVFNREFERAQSHGLLFYIL